MNHILKKIKINNYTYLFFLLCFFCGYIKNIIIIYFICLFHEFGHVFFIKLYNYEILSIEIFPFGGYTSINKRINTSIKKDIIIALGGIINQLILLIITYIFKNNINTLTYNLIVYYNLIIIVFNMLPIIPLDGNKIIHYLLDYFFPFQLSYILNYMISIIFLIIFIIINIIFKTDNYFILLFLICKLVLDIKNYKYIKYRFIIERYTNEINFKKIDNHTKNIKELRREVYHYFKKNNKYINEKEIIKNYLNKNRPL